MPTHSERTYRVNPLIVRLVTVVSGILGAWLAQRLGLPVAEANEVSAAVLFFFVGWAMRNPADRQELPHTAIINYQDIIKLGDPTHRKPDEPAKGA